MAICKNLANIMGGKLEVIRACMGSEFSFSIYLKTTEQPAAQNDGKKPNEKFDFSGMPCAGRRRQRDKHGDNGGAAQGRGHGGGAGFDGRQAVAMFEASPEDYYDLVMMDIQMR
jgi:hypothetical protein